MIFHTALFAPYHKGASLQRASGFRQWQNGEYMVTRTDILALEFIKHTPYTGSFEKMRYRLEKVKVEDDTRLLCTAYPGPYNYVKTPEEYRISSTFPFSEEGILEAIDFLNENYDEVVKNYGSLLANNED